MTENDHIDEFQCPRCDEWVLKSHKDEHAAEHGEEYAEDL